jgi:hypothetical protein
MPALPSEGRSETDQAALARRWFRNGTGEGTPPRQFLEVCKVLRRFGLRKRPPKSLYAAHSKSFTGVKIDFKTGRREWIVTSDYLNDIVAER